MHLPIQSFIEDPENPPVIIGHELLPGQVQRQTNTFNKVYRGAVHQFGTKLPEEAIINAGLGFILKTDGAAIPWILPSKLIRGEREAMTIAGESKTFPCQGTRKCKILLCHRDSADVYSHSGRDARPNGGMATETKNPSSS
jgi:hypothetical protein